MASKHVAAVLSAFLMLVGCTGSDDGPNVFTLCGNMVIDKNEECDDGNTLDNDDCLGTCILNRCGDELLNTLGPQNVEMCDGRNLNNRTCFNFGFQGGTLSCTGECTFDTSACTSAPTPTPSAPPTPTATIP